MGGQINMAFRFSDGEACCFDRWTNNMGVLSNIDILDGDEQPVRDYIAMCRNNDYIVDPDYNGKPVRVSTSGYGLALIDFVSKTIIDCNCYTSLFGDIHSFSIREGDEEDWMARHYHLIKKALERGRGVIEKRYEHKKAHQEPVIFRYDDVSALSGVMKKASADRNGLLPPKYYYIYSIDTAPWTYYCTMGDHASERKAALQLARDIGFPMTRKEGLNKNYPYPKQKKEVAPEEIRARFLWMKMKSMDEYKNFDGTPWEKLSFHLQDTILDMGRKMTPDEYDQMRFQEFIGATTFNIRITA